MPNQINRESKKVVRSLAKTLIKYTPAISLSDLIDDLDLHFTGSTMAEGFVRRVSLQIKEELGEQ